MATSPPYIRLSNGDFITFERLGPKRTAVLSNSEGVLIRKGNALIGATEKQQANTIILGFPYPNPTIIEEILTPISPTVPTTPPTRPAEKTIESLSPQELENKRDGEKIERKKIESNLALQQLTTSAIISAASQTSALDKLNQLINSKTAVAKDLAIKQLLILVSELGIEGLETGNPKIPDLCPPLPVLDKATIIRDSLLNNLENVAVYINTVNKSLSIVNSLLKGSITTVTAINLIKTTAAIAIKAAPVVPGIVTSLLADLDDVRTLLTFDTEGNPKLIKLKRAVENGTTYISTAANTINILLGLLLVIDKVLIKCGKTIKPVGSGLKDLIAETVIAESSNTDTLYKGFTFEIVEKYFSPTINRKIGQAKNSQGIVLLQTEPSFTQDPKVLIEELKLIIDRDNLKAN